MMRIVIDEQRAAAWPANLAELLQPALDALEARERALNGLIRDAELGAPPPPPRAS